MNPWDPPDLMSPLHGGCCWGASSSVCVWFTGGTMHIWSLTLTWKHTCSHPQAQTQTDVKHICTRPHSGREVHAHTCTHIHSCPLRQPLQAQGTPQRVRGPGNSAGLGRSCPWARPRGRATRDAPDGGSWDLSNGFSAPKAAEAVHQQGCWLVPWLPVRL